MAETTSIVSGVADRYASALFEVALESGAQDQVARDLESVLALISESPDFARLISSPVFSADEQLRAVGAVLDRAGIGGLAANIVKLTARNRRLFAVPSIAKAYRALLAAHKGEVSAEVATASPLTDLQVEALKASLKGVTGGKDVALTTSVDPSLIGGLVVKVGSRMIDTSIRTKLSSLKVALKEVR